METSLVLTQLVGLFFILMGVSMFVRPRMIDEMIAGFERNKALMLVTGLFTFIGGFLMVSAHNVWAWSSCGFVTVVAWGAMIKGAMYVIMPDWMIAQTIWFTNMGKLQKVLSVAIVLVGIWLTAVGFGFMV